MPRSPEVCLSAFCPLKYATRSLTRILTYQSLVGSIFLRGVTPALHILTLVVFQLSLMTVYGQTAAAVGFQQSTTPAGKGIFVVPIPPPHPDRVWAQGFTTARALESSSICSSSDTAARPLFTRRSSGNEFDEHNRISLVTYKDLSLWPPSKRAVPAMFRRESTSAEPPFLSAHDIVFSLVVVYALCSLVLALARLLAEDVMITTLVFVNGWRRVQESRTKRQERSRRDQPSTSDGATPSDPETEPNESDRGV